jgi:hypothetical protein
MVLLRNLGSDSDSGTFTGNASASLAGILAAHAYSVFTDHLTRILTPQELALINEWLRIEVGTGLLD